MFLYCTSQGVVTIVKWLISLVITSNHKCLNKIVSNKLALIIFEPGTQPQRWYIILDRYTKFVAVKHVHSYDAGTTVKTMCEVFSEFGLPENICSD